MLALVGFSLILLACSYWRIVSYPRDNQQNAGAENFCGERMNSCSEISESSSIEGNMKVVVVMAGDEKPTFLARPIASY